MFFLNWLIFCPIGHNWSKPSNHYLIKFLLYNSKKIEFRLKSFWYASVKSIAEACLQLNHHTNYSAKVLK